ncbi:RHS repeat protein [Pseudomonas gingeri]
MVLTLTSPSGIRYDMGTYYSDRFVGFYLTAKVLTDAPDLSETYFLAKKATDLNGNWISYTYKQFGRPFTLNIPTNTELTYDNCRRGIAKYYPQCEQSSILLSNITSSDGRTVDFDYDPSKGRLLSIKDNSQRVTRYEYSAEDLQNDKALIKVTGPTGESWKYKYQQGPFNFVPNSPISDASASIRKLIEIELPSGGRTTFDYTHVNMQSTLIVTNGGRGLFKRFERVSRKTTSEGHQWTYAYVRGGAGQYDTTTVTGPEGVSRFEFIGPGYNISNWAGAITNSLWLVGSPVKTTRPDGSYETFKWSQRVFSAGDELLYELGLLRDQVIWSADLQEHALFRNGATYTTQYSNYDAFGNPGTRTETGPNGGSRTTTLTYFNDPVKWIIGLPASEAFPGSSVARTFDANGRVTSMTRDGVTTHYTYDGQGELASQTLPGNRLYSYSNYKLGTPQTEAQPENIILTRVVDSAGNVTSQTNGEGKTTRYTYDSLNRLTSMVPAAGNIKTFVYTPTSKTATRGLLIETTQYDPFARVASVTLGGVTTRYEYDGLNRRTFASDPGATTGTRYQYDALGRVTRTTNADGTYQSISYGAGTREITDERGKITTFTYRGYGDPDQLQLMSVIAPEAAANITLTRNARDQITSVTQGGFTRTYDYNTNGYLTSIANPETGTTTYGRDIAGNMISRQVGVSGITNYTYDGMNRLVSTVYPGTTPTITHTYNKLGKRLTSNTVGGNRSFAYDDVGNLIQESLALDGKVFNVTYGFNANDQLTSITYPQSARVVDYTPDVLGRPTTVSGYVNSVEYWPSGLIKHITYANGTVTSYDQNSRLWPASFTLQKTGDALSYLNSTYTYDGAGNLTTISDSTDSGFNRTLGYDNINRLTNIAGPWGLGSITYDGGGNLISQTFGPSSLAYTYDANNRLNAVTGARISTYDYDSYGNISSSQGNTYTYNDVPNLVCVNCSTPQAQEYSYDGLNQRSAVLKASGKVYEMHDSNGKQLMELDAGTLTEYFYLGDKRIAQQVSP